VTVETAACPLTCADFGPLATNGFGDAQNSYAHAMAWFRDRLFVGTSRNALPLLKLFPPRDPPAMDPWPVPVPGRVEDIDLHGEIWRLDLATGARERVHRSPDIPSRTGGEVPREIGYRGMTVFRGRSDTEPALYVSSISSVARGTGARLLRSADGAHFEPVGEPGLGNPAIASFRSLTPFDGHLYAAPAGEGTRWNTVSRPVLLRSADPANGPWQTACEPGFGDPSNIGIFELAVFDGHLYAGTFNALRGYQLWRTPASGGGPCRWTRVLDGGAGRGSRNEIAMSLRPFRGALYVGSGIQNGGYDRMNFVGPAAAELVRVHPDGSWELIAGEPRTAGQGRRAPLSGAGPGFDNLFAGYLWRLEEHDGWLYASTFDWSVFLPYAHHAPRGVRRMMRRIGADRMVQLRGGFDLLRSADGVSWTSVTHDGLGNPYNHGGRNLLSTPHGLVVGTANPFGPEVAARIATGWVYAANPAGGAEVWLGRPPPAAPLAPRNGRRRRPVLVTGGGALLGGEVVEALLADGHRVRVLALPGTEEDVDPAADVVSGDIADAAALDRACRGVRVVYHLAGRLPGSARHELEQVNVRGTQSVLRAVAAAAVRRVVFMSSVAVYEGAFLPDDWPLTERAPLGPRAPDRLRDYGLSKIAGERAARSMAEEAGFELAILRPSTCYGLGGTAIEDLVDVALSGPARAVREQGGHPLQLLHVRDLAEATLLAGGLAAAAGATVNVAGSEAVSFAELCRLIRSLDGQSDPPTVPEPDAPWRRFMCPYDISLARRLLGFVPRVTLAEGLAEIVAEMPDPLDLGDEDAHTGAGLPLATLAART
jgi:nucleoside-diphosphate-sugar epimerase